MRSLNEGDKITVRGYDDVFIVLKINVGPASLVRCRPDRSDTRAEYEFPEYKIDKLL
jgi:hypothetical protein